jgi:D-beta-D-heptose 7-phosphate kinase/D-beta-D-heptose 1-phosphate adenosyltransferase
MRIIVNGTFDILHRGHLEMLQYAKSLGDYLMVAIDTDRRVKELKGPTRPVNNEKDRAYMLKSLKAVDYCWTFDSDNELREIIKIYSPDIMVKGSDWRGKDIVGGEFCKEIRFFERINDYSTTNTIQDIINR